MSDLFSTPAAPADSQLSGPRIELIQISNIGPIEAATIDYAGGLLVSAVGQNGSGKSTASLVFDALQGKFDPKALKAGADKGTFEIEFSYQGQQIRCVCTLTRFKSGDESKVEQALQFFGPDAKQIGVGKATELVKFLVGTKPEFDVNEFIATTAPAKRKEMMQKLSGVDLAPLVIAEKAAENERTEANRKVKEQQARALPYDEELATKEPISAADLSAQKTTIQDHNTKFDRAKERHTQNEQSAKDVDWNIQQIEAQIKDLQTKLQSQNDAKKSIAKSVGDGEKWLQDPANAPKDTTAIDLQLADLTATNERISQSKRLKTESATLEQLQVVAQEKEKAVVAARDAKLTAIKKAQLPAGLAFDPDSEVGLLLNGQPIERASSAELTIAALQCATRGTGALHWIHVDCKALDYVNFQKVCEWLKDQKWQALLEKPAQNESELQLQFHVV